MGSLRLFLVRFFNFPVEQRIAMDLKPSAAPLLVVPPFSLNSGNRPIHMNVIAPGGRRQGCVIGPGASVFAAELKFISIAGPANGAG